MCINCPIIISKKHPIAKNSFEYEPDMTFWDFYLQDVEEIKLGTEH